MLLDHLELSTLSFAAMCAFYDNSLAPLGISRIVPGSPAGYGDENDLPFWIRTSDTKTINAHYAFGCATRAMVHNACDAAIAAGGTGLREPKLHPHIDPHYYAGYAHDPDGHLVEFVCRAAEG